MKEKEQVTADIIEFPVSLLLSLH